MHQAPDTQLQKFNKTYQKYALTLKKIMVFYYIGVTSTDRPLRKPHHLIFWNLIYAPQNILHLFFRTLIVPVIVLMIFWCGYPIEIRVVFSF
ncbi:hypothetical protein QD47_09535 [Paenibacillus terrae]|uniref:Uncharacterized protein n=1 Tax=Paenibacillus terrae TaxID=159743 RepID=A0A0D7X381_9BACL|nr:hypothetical protein QD47_09535 [Paenibacillus terrae]